MRRWSGAAWASFTLSIGIVAAFVGFFRFRFAEAQHEAYSRSERLLLTGAKAMGLAANSSDQWLLNQPTCRNGLVIGSPPTELKAAHPAPTGAPSRPQTPSPKQDSAVLPCITFEQILAFIPKGKQLFDKTLIAANDGAVLAQSTSASAPTLVAIGQLKKLGADKKRTDQPVTLEGMGSSATVEAGDDVYQLFCEPLSTLGLSNGDPAARLRLCGMLGDARLTRDCLAVSPLYLITLGGLLALVLLLPPFVRTALLAPCQRLRFFDAFTVGVCLFFWLMLAALFGVDFYRYQDLAQESRQRLEQLAQTAELRLKEDFTRAWQVVDELAGQEPDLVARAAVPPALTLQPPQLPIPPLQQPRDPRDAKVDIEIEGVAWAGVDGKQRVKWVKAKDNAAPLVTSAQLVDVSGRDYFKRALREPTEKVEDSIKTYTSGQTRAVFAKAAEISAGKGVVTLTAALPALLGARLPDGIGFAVMEHDGRVVFHSEEALSNSHNLIEETENNADLIELLRADEPSGYIETLRYWGIDHSAVLRPLTARWTIVTFEESEPRRLVLFRAAARAILYSALYTLGVVALLAVYLWLVKRQMPQCWPDRRRSVAYWIFAGVSVAGGGACALLQEAFDGLGTVISLLLPPLLGLAALLLAARDAEPSKPGARQPWYSRHLISYPLACGLFWVAGATLPAVAIGNHTAAEASASYEQRELSAWRASARDLREASGKAYDVQHDSYARAWRLPVGKRANPPRSLILTLASVLASLVMIVLIVYWALDTLFLWGVEAAPDGALDEALDQTLRPLWLLVSGPRTPRKAPPQVFGPKRYIEQSAQLAEHLEADAKAGSPVNLAVVFSPRSPFELMREVPSTLSAAARIAWQELAATLRIRSYCASQPPSKQTAGEAARKLLRLSDEQTTFWTGFAWLAEELGADAEVLVCCQRNLTEGSLAALELLELKRRVRDACTDYYAELWLACTELERLTLLQLAQEGFVNPRRSEVVRSLMRRGLIRRRPMLAPFSDTFSMFICAAGQAENLPRLEVSEGFSWVHLRAPTLTAIVCAAAALFYTQRALFDTTVMFATTLTGILPQIGTWLTALGITPADRMVAAATRSLPA